MFKRNNHPQHDQSSESQLSSENQREVPKVYNGKHKDHGKYDNDDDSLNLNEGSQSDSEAEENQEQNITRSNQVQSLGKGVKNSNGQRLHPQMGQKDKKRQQYHQQQQSSQQDSIEQRKIVKKAKQQDSQQEQQRQESQSQQEDSYERASESYFNKINSKNGIHTIRQDPKESLEQDDSIDHIEQRIKKLEKDLQNRLNKHKQPQKNQDFIKKNQGKIIGTGKASPHPPIPQKKVGNQDAQNRMNAINQPIKKYAHLTNEKVAQLKGNSQNHTHNTNEQIANSLKQTTKQKKFSKRQQNPQVKNTSNSQSHKPKSQKGEKKPKNGHPLTQKQKQSNNFFNDRVPHQNTSHSHAHSNGKISQLQKMIKELKLENQVLKQKLDMSERREKEKDKEREKQRERQSSTQKSKDKAKSKYVEQFQKINEMSEDSLATKLQKQIQLLQVIQKIQAKLKKSISKKLAKQGNVPSSLLHKGLPTSLKAQF